MIGLLSGGDLDSQNYSTAGKIFFHHELNKNVFVLLCKAAACLDIIKQRQESNCNKNTQLCLLARVS